MDVEEEEWAGAVVAGQSQPTRKLSRLRKGKPSPPTLDENVDINVEIDPSYLDLESEIHALNDAEIRENDDEAAQEEEEVGCLT